MTQKKKFCLGGIYLLFTFLTLTPAWSQTNAPALSISLTASNQVTLTITNGIGTNVYEIYYTEFLTTNSEWTLLSTGSQGQTNFLANIDETETGYFKAVNGNDWDSDGIPNAWDARPNDPGIGLLTVAIEAPANGANVQ
jgi:hypothetical protein